MRLLGTRPERISACQISGEHIMNPTTSSAWRRVARTVRWLTTAAFGGLAVTVGIAAAQAQAATAAVAAPAAPAVAAAPQPLNVHSANWSPTPRFGPAVPAR